jgi:hypothetical protein
MAQHNSFEEPMESPTKKLFEALEKGDLTADPLIACFWICSTDWIKAKTPQPTAWIPSGMP